MSKTIRRKAASALDIYENVDRYLESWNRLYPYLPLKRHDHITFEYIEQNKKRLRKELLAHYHSDTFWTWNAPAWFRRDMNRHYRLTNNRILAKSIRDDNEHEVVFIPFKRNVLWEWH